MASSSKKKTTMAKHNRENAVRERRLRKQAKKEARKQLAADIAAGRVQAPVEEADDRDLSQAGDRDVPGTAV